MRTIGYIRVSTEEQDLSKQKHLLLEYSQQQHVLIDEFIEVEMSSRKTPASAGSMNCSPSSKQGIG